MNDLEQQVKVSKMLGLAFVFSITPLFGVVALILGLRASRIIQASRGRISGGVMAWWCILAGALGIVLTLATILKKR